MNPIKPHVMLARSATIRKVQDMVLRSYGKDYRVELFGSTSYGIDTPTSDLDLVIMVRTRVQLYSPSSLSFDQDSNRMNGLSPNLDLRRLPRKRVMYLMDRLRTWDSLSSQSCLRRNVCRGRDLSHLGGLKCLIIGTWLEHYRGPGS